LLERSSSSLSAALNPVRESVKLMDNLFDASMRELKVRALFVHVLAHVAPDRDN
jgi:hypothetical protein